MEAVREREKVTDHDVAAFVDVVAESVGEAGRWVHHGLTSSDVLDTALALQLAQAGMLLVGGDYAYRDALVRRAREHAGTLCVGRTHGVHAEPTTFGVKLAGFAFEAQRSLRRLERAVEGVSVGALSGAVGTYSANGPEIEASVLQRLGLGRDQVSTQVVPRDRHAELLQAVALAGAGLERLATEVRHLQRTEVREVEEPFGAGQKGSSAMPHKRNPIVSERICGIARLLRGYSQAGLEDVALWHERDISHSSVERVVLHDEEGDRLAVIPASERLDLVKTRELLGGTRAVRLATEEEMAADFAGFEVGALPPIGPLLPAPEVLDRRLLDHDRILVTGGDHRHGVLLDPNDLVQVTQAKVADICEE